MDGNTPLRCRNSSTLLECNVGGNVENMSCQETSGQQAEISDPSVTARRKRANKLAQLRRLLNPEKTREKDRTRYAKRLARDHQEFWAKRKEIQARYRAKKRKERGVTVELVF
jgi:hypothetical protein